MKSVALLFAGLVLTACGSDQSENATSTPANGIEKSGSFHGILGDKTYTVAVSCQHLDKDYFMFLSDQSDVGDSNGDGLNISGMESDGKLVLTIVDHGESWSSNPFSTAQWSKNSNGATGSAALNREGGSGESTLEYTVTCS